MRKFTGVVLCSLVLICGCATHKSSPAKPKKADVASKPVVTPDYRPVGIVAKVDTTGKFIVISFPVGNMPKQDDLLNIYHSGLKVAEVRVDTKYQSEGNIIADIIAGDVQVGDEARQN